MAMFKFLTDYGSNLNWGEEWRGVVLELPHQVPRAHDYPVCIRDETQQNP